MNKPTFCSAGIIIASLGKITTRNNAYNSLLVLVAIGANHSAHLFEYYYVVLIGAHNTAPNPDIVLNGTHNH